MIEVVNAILPENKPRYLMGVGTVEDLLNGIARGIDIFDCVLPTRLARHQAAMTRRGPGQPAECRARPRPPPD